jgi:hypothetical protein
MKVFILSPKLGNNRSVIIRTENGEARVVWRGDAPPSVGETNVELTLPGPLRWGTEVMPAASGERTGIREDGSVVALVDEIDVDGVMKLRIGYGLVMIAPTGNQPPISAGDLVHIQGTEIEIHPVNF